nr:MAG TPA: hypothetical protein [Caudoviricetes sp.]
MFANLPVTFTSKKHPFQSANITLLVLTFRNMLFSNFIIRFQTNSVGSGSLS